MDNEDYIKAGGVMAAAVIGVSFLAKGIYEIRAGRRCRSSEGEPERHEWDDYDKNGYNQLGIDKAGHGRKYYRKVMKQLRIRLDEGYQQLQHGQFRYAIYDARAVLHTALKLIVQHTNGTDHVGDHLLENMKICEREHLLGDNTDFLTRLHEVRCICECSKNGFTAHRNLNYHKVYFVVMQVKDLLNQMENMLG